MVRFVSDCKINVIPRNLLKVFKLRAKNIVQSLVIKDFGMFNYRSFLSTVVLLFLFSLLHASNELQMADLISSPDSFLIHTENRNFHLQIGKQLDRIESEYKVLQPGIRKQISVLQVYIQLKEISNPKKVFYLQVLIDYLTKLSGPQAASFIKSGRVLGNLRFYSAIIDFNERGELLGLLQRDELSSVKAVPLFSSMAGAREFLLQFALKDPDEVLRNYDAFRQEKYAPEVLIKIAGFAPLTIQKYLSSYNEVRKAIYANPDTVCRSLVRIYSDPAYRFYAFLFIDQVLKGQAIPAKVEDLGSNKILFFKTLSDMHFRPEVMGKYSIDQQLKLLSTDIIREINYYYSNGYKNNVQSILSSFTPDELLLIYLYGHRDATSFSFGSFIELIRSRTQKKFGAKFFSTIHEEDLHSFLAVAENFQKMDDVLSLVDPSYRDNLLQAISIDEPKSISYEHYLDVFLKLSITVNTLPSEVVQLKPAVEVVKEQPVVVKENTKQPAASLVKEQPVVAVNDNKTPAEAPVLKEQPVVDVKENVKQPSTSVVKEQPVIAVKEDIAKVPVKEDKLSSVPSPVKTDIKEPSPVKFIKEDQITGLVKKNDLLLMKEQDPAIEPPKRLPDPEPVLQPLLLKIQIPEKEKAIFELLRDVDRGLSNPTSILEKRYALDVLNQVALLKPDDIFRYTKSLQSKFWIKNVLETAAHQAPNSFKRYLPNEYHPVNLILKHSTDSIVTRMFDMYADVGYRSNCYIIMDDIVCGRLSIAAADRLVQDKDSMLHEMLHIVQKPGSIGLYTLESNLRDEALQFIRKINDLNVMDDAVRYASVNRFDASELYLLMIYGQDEMFRSSFTGLYSRMKSKMGGNGYNLLKSVNFIHFRTFVKLCSSFNMLDDFLSTMTADQRKEVITRFVSNLDTERFNSAEIVNVPDALAGIVNQQDKALICATVKTEFERVQASGNGSGQIIYGLLATILQPNATMERKWFNQVALTFHLPLIDRVFNESLFNSEGECIQEHYFYNDEDGKGSFVNFMNTWRGLPNWAIDMHESYVEIYSTAGKKIRIFANKPDYEQNGINEIQKIFRERNLSPLVVVHRGHSFHTEKTLSQIPPDTKIVIVGSCGGYYKISIAVERAPESHIISTRQIGTMRVNDPLIRAISEEIRLGHDIVWSDFWSTMEKQIGKVPNFPDYIPPHKNMGSLFLQAYFEAIDKH